MSKSMSQAFGAVVRKRREGIGISQEELAARSGIHRTYVSSIELGKVRLGLEIAKKVSGGLGIRSARSYRAALPFTSSEVRRLRRTMP